jgi:predicted amidohydrolase YtcJ
MAMRELAVEQDGPVRNAELVIHGTVLTVDESQPTAEALAVTDGRIAAVGRRADVEPLIGPDTTVLDIGDGCVMPGLVEAHGHPLMEAIVLSDRMVDIRPVTIPDADGVVAAIHDEIGRRGAGSLEVGKYADFVVLSADPRSVPPERIADLVVRATFLAAEQVYAKS